ncbi:MAG: hypothetical protein HXK69_03555 [Clostridiales bacterium]|nr:hypothetical protein [Clostridiales bacterium]
MEENSEKQEVKEINDNVQSNNNNPNNTNLNSNNNQKEDASKEQQKSKKKSFKILLATILPIIIMCIITSIFGPMLIKKAEQNRLIKTLVLASCLPELPVRPIEIKENSNTVLKINQKNIDKQTYDQILAKVKEKYPLDNQDISTSYEAYDSNGTKIILKPQFDTLEIKIRKLSHYGDIIWPTSGLASTIPKPLSTKGIISINRDEYFSADIQYMTKEDLRNYFEQCKQYGYNVNIRELNQKIYESKNQNGDRLSLRYDGGNVVSITVEQGRKKSQFSELSNSQSNDNQVSNNEDEKVKQEFQKTMKEVEQRLQQQKETGIDPKFQKLVDDYLRFMLADYWVKGVKYKANPTDQQAKEAYEAAKLKDKEYYAFAFNIYAENNKLTEQEQKLYEKMRATAKNLQKNLP